MWNIIWLYIFNQFNCKIYFLFNLIIILKFYYKTKKINSSPFFLHAWAWTYTFLLKRYSSFKIILCANEQGSNDISSIWNTRLREEMETMGWSVININLIIIQINLDGLYFHSLRLPMFRLQSVSYVNHRCFSSAVNAS